VFVVFAWVDVLAEIGRREPLEQEPGLLFLAVLS
jgi:hypothetical protein